jgi:hypothetical protein
MNSVYYVYGCKRGNRHLFDGYTLINEISYTICIRIVYALYTIFLDMENQPKQVISFRVSVAEMSALEALQQPEDSSISKTALRLLQGLLGVQDSPSVNVVNANEIRGRVEGLEERLNGAIITREQLSDFVNDIVDKRIQHLADALSDHENRLISIEQAPVKPEATTQDVVLPLPQEKLESAIASEATQENVVSALAGKKLSKAELKSKSNSIYRTLKTKGLEINLGVIKGRILEMYPNSEDWISDDARLDVIRALEKQHR